MWQKLLLNLKRLLKAEKTNMDDANNIPVDAPADAPVVADPATTWADDSAIVPPDAVVIEAGRPEIATDGFGSYYVG